MAKLTQADIMQMIHGSNIFVGYMPQLAEDTRGWNSEHESFDEIIAGIRPEVLIDVGVWKGGSTIHMAELLKRHGVAGTIISIDTFLGSLEHWNRDSDAFNLVFRRHGMPMLYDQFLSNLVLRGVSDMVVPLPQTSTTAALLLQRLGIQAQLIHIDASHEYEDVLTDCRAYWDVLAPGGFLIGDDYHEYWPGVIKAADEFSSEKGLQMWVRSPKWIVRKPNDSSGG